MKTDGEYNKSDVERAYNCLVDDGYIKKGTGQDKTSARITSKGVKIFDNSKFFSDKKNIKSINVGDGSQVNIALGDNNTQNNVSINELDDLLNVIRRSDLNEVHKRNYNGDINTIKSQLTKENPTPTIIKTAWKSLQAVATIEGASSLIVKIGEKLSNFLL